MMNEKIKVSVIIPCRNERNHIGKCLDSIIANDFPHKELEIMVVDGLSDDGTCEIVKKYTDTFTFIKSFQNKKKIVPSALNIGIENAKGEIIIRMDAHNIYEKDYISKCIYYLNAYKVDNVGGIWITKPGAYTVIAKSIALAISHPFGIGNAHYRLGGGKTKYVDTVPFGCYRKEVFENIGYFDEELIRNQDDEFNHRLIRSGGKILLVPHIVSYYYSRDSLLKLWKMYFQYGYFKPLVVRKVKAVLTWRQLMPAVFVGTIILSGLLSLFFNQFLYLLIWTISSYLIVNIGISFIVSLKNSSILFFVLPLVFSVLHFSYGLGYLKGIVDFFIRNIHKRGLIGNMPMTR